MNNFSPEGEQSVQVSNSLSTSLPRTSRELHFRDPLQLIPRVLSKLYTLWVKATHPFISLGAGVSFHYTTDLFNTGLMQIGNLLTVHKDVWLHVRAMPGHPASPVLVIEDHCFIGRRSHIAAKNGIHIERDVMLAASVLIQDHGHAFDDVHLPIREQGVAEGGKIRIGQGCWIGQGATIICDSGQLTLGRNCVVAANAVVTRSAPAYSVLTGNPARIVKQYDPAKGMWVLGASRLADSDNAKQPQAPTSPDAKPDSASDSGSPSDRQILTRK